MPTRSGIHDRYQNSHIELQIATSHPWGGEVSIARQNTQLHAAERLPRKTAHAREKLCKGSDNNKDDNK